MQSELGYRISTIGSGTSSFYAAMRDFIAEPVLRQIAARISADEVHHYKLFRRHLKKYEECGAGIPLRERFRILIDRIDERDDDEFGYAYYSANIAGSTGEAYDREKCALAYERVALGLYREAHLKQGARMMLKAIGFDTDSLFTRATMPLAWFLVQRRQRQLNREAETGAPAMQQAA